MIRRLKTAQIHRRWRCTLQNIHMHAMPGQQNWCPGSKIRARAAEFVHAYTKILQMLLLHFLVKILEWSRPLISGSVLSVSPKSSRSLPDSWPSSKMWRSPTKHICRANARTLCSQTKTCSIRYNPLTNCNINFKKKKEKRGGKEKIRASKFFLVSLFLQASQFKECPATLYINNLSQKI